jgi:hypothetical protein
MKEKQPLYLRGIDKTKARQLVRNLTRHAYQPPIACVHVFGKRYPAPPPDHNVTLQACKLCKLVVGHVA